MLCGLFNFSRQHSGERAEKRSGQGGRRDEGARWHRDWWSGTRQEEPAGS